MFSLAYLAPEERVALLLKKMRETIKAPFKIDGFEFFLTLSVGLVGREKLKTADAEEALRLADGALNLAKKQGGDIVVHYREEIEKHYRDRLVMESGLRKAISTNELKMYYQPKVSLKTGLVSGVEALIRWQKSDGSFVSPADFIPVAEESGQILEIGDWVLRQTIADVKAWNAVIQRQVDVAINVSAIQLLHKNLVGDISALTDEQGLPRSIVELEITETAALEDFGRAIEKLEGLSRAGFSISLDDFGTGYSSLSYLQQMPVNKLKIDRAFVKDLSRGCKQETLTRTMLEMAHQMGLEVVAEGVETEEQLEILRDWNCEYVQGYLLAKPMPLTNLIDYLQNFSRLDSTRSASA